MKKQIPPEISEYFSKMAKKTHKDKPRGKAYYVKIARRRWNKQSETKTVEN